MRGELSESDIAELLEVSDLGGHLIGHTAQMIEARQSQRTQQVGLLEEQPACDLGTQAWVARQQRRAIREVEKNRRRLDERAAVVEFEHRHLRNPALGQIAGGFTSPLASRA